MIPDEFRPTIGNRPSSIGNPVSFAKAPSAIGASHTSPAPKAWDQARTIQRRTNGSIHRGAARRQIDAHSIPVKMGVR